jgi:filamentous hemagglutinin family protein
MLRSRTISLLAAVLIAVPPAAFANPLGGQVAGGQATIQGQGTKTVTVTQGTQNAIINWNTFNIGTGELTQFIQPSATSIALNRVIGGLGPSEINGHLTGNGRIFLVNPNGVLIGSGGVIDTAGFLASTNNIRNADFMAGNYKFSIPGRPVASIVNLGNITATNGGFAALVAPGVRNAGVITANLGHVALASGNGFTLDFYGDKLITLQIGDEIKHKVIDVATGQPLDALVKNEGLLRANGGQIALTAVAARHVVDSVINNKGVIEANSVGTKNGMIVLGAATAAPKRHHKVVQQTVKVSGTLSAAGQKVGEKGGVIQITGEKIVLADAKLDASGQAGGGTVLVGRDLSGNAALTAASVNIDAASVINASATATGDGGKVVVWSNGATTAAGSIYATGGPIGGDGGFVETSGQTVNFTGVHVDTSAPAGASGLWLVDPNNLIVDSNAATTISNNLATTDITLQTNLDGSTLGPGETTGGPGDIIVNASIAWPSTHTLTLNAAHDIVFNASMTAPTGGLSLQAASNISAVADVKVGTFTLQNGNWTQVGPTLPAFSANDFRLKGGTFLRAAGGTGSSTSPYAIVDVYGLQGIGSPSHLLLDKSFALGANVDAKATLNWNGGAGFVPIGDAQFAFNGTLDGQTHVIDGLGINSTARYTGLFGFIGTGGAVDDVTLTNVQVNATQNNFNGWVGALAGWNGGQIARSSATGTVSGALSYDIGGLVGRNVGTIAQSSADVTTSGGEFSALGGLVGNNEGSIFQSFSVGSVNAGSGSFIGGLVGWNLSGTIDQSYAAGAVSAPGTAIGGLVGFNAGRVTSSYWDTQVTAQTAGVGTNNGTFQATGLTTAQSLQQSSYVGFNFGANGWSIVDGQTRPSFTQPQPPSPPEPPPSNKNNTTPTFAQLPPPNQQVVAPTFSGSGTPIQINLTALGTVAPGGGAAGGSGSGGAKPNYGPSPGQGLGRTADEQQYSGVPPPNETRFRSGEVVVQVVDTIPVAQVVQIAQGLGMVLIASEPLEQTHRIIYRFGAPATASVRTLILGFEKNYVIASAGPNYLFGFAQNAPAAPAPPPPSASDDRTKSIPPANEAAPGLANSDTAALESLPAGDAAQYVIDKFHLGAVHRLASGRNVTIAVVDSEIDVTHPDLRGVVVDRFDATKSPSKPHPHGTGMAGAIASHTRLLGVAPGVRIIAIKTFDDTGSSAESTSYQIVKGLDYAITKNARIINLSFAGPRDPMMERTLKAAHDKGIILIAAAGNAGPKSPPLYPGADPSVIAVSATDYDDKPFAMANRGKYIAVAAPGVDVMVPAPNSGYQLTTGTSVAAAHVSGVAALLVERKPTITPDEVRALLMKTATAFSAKPKGEEDGAGLVDPAGALQAATGAKTSDLAPLHPGLSAAKSAP